MFWVALVMGFVAGLIISHMRDKVRQRKWNRITHQDWVGGSD